MRSITKKSCISAGTIALIALMLPTLAFATELQLETEPGEPLPVESLVLAESSNMEIADTLLYGDVRCDVGEQNVRLLKNSGDVSLASQGGEASGCDTRGNYLLPIYDFMLAELRIVQPGTGTVTVSFTSDPGGWECSWEGVGTFSYEAGTDTIELEHLPLETSENCGSEAELNGDFTFSSLQTGEPVLIVDPRWTIQPPSPEAGGGLYDVSCVSDTECIAVGVDYPNGFAERWNGSEWSALPGSLPMLAEVSCASSTLCVALPWQPGPGAMRWNGSEWSTITASAPAGGKGPKLMHVSCGSPTSCIAVGNYVDTSGSIRSLTESYDGEEWTVMSTPSGSAGDFLSAISCPSSNSCTALGRVGGGSGALRWNGSDWSTMPAPGYISQDSDISCTSASTCMAVAPLAAETQRWDGSKWTGAPVPKAEAGGGNPELAAVSCPSAEECIAIGSYERSTGDYGPLAERWNGSEWEPQEALIPAGAAEVEMFGVSCSSADRCTAVGWSNTTPVIERYQ